MLNNIEGLLSAHLMLWHIMGDYWLCIILNTFQYESSSQVMHVYVLGTCILPPLPDLTIGLDKSLNHVQKSELLFLVHSLISTSSIRDIAICRCKGSRIIGTFRPIILPWISKWLTYWRLSSSLTKLIKFNLEFT